MTKIAQAMAKIQPIIDEYGIEVVREATLRLLERDILAGVAKRHNLVPHTAEAVEKQGRSQGGVSRFSRN